MKKINVVAAVILKEDQVLIAQRLKGEFAGLWEFPGGKVELGETDKEALKREIMEEMEINISVDEFLVKVEHDYSTFHLTMDCYICHLLSNDIHLNDHSEIQWITYNQQDIDWVPADTQVIEALRNRG